MSTPFTNFCATLEENTLNVVTNMVEYGQNIPTLYWVLLALVSGMAFVHFKKNKQDQKKKADTEKEAIKAKESLLKKLKKLKAMIVYRVFNNVHTDNKEKRDKGLSGDVLVNNGNAKSLVNKMKKKEKTLT